MQWVLLGVIGFLVVYALRTRLTMASLDKGIPPAVGNAVLYAAGAERDPYMRQAFARELALNGYPLAANAMVPGTAKVPSKSASPSTGPTKSTTPISVVRPGTVLVQR